jgi:FRG domain
MVLITYDAGTAAPVSLHNALAGTDGMAAKRGKRSNGNKEASDQIRVLSTWEAFLDLITDSPYANWAFRGQCDAAWPLLSALSRYFVSFHVHPDAWQAQESRMLRIFKPKAHQFLSYTPDPDDDFQWLALMQHHGAPTRLLDLTWSPYVAAFFALERATGDAAIWALNPAHISYASSIALRDGHTIHPQVMDPRERGNLHRYFLAEDIPCLWIGEPYIMNPRLTAQSGTFAVPGTLSQPIEAILSRYPEPRETLVKLILPSTQVREQGMRELYRMNITYATLFPDLDGLARSLAYELEFHWGYDPRTQGGRVDRSDSY